MPEGDTVFRQATALHQALAGQLVETSDFRVPRYAGLDLSGSTVEEVFARGKYLLMRVGQYSIISHLKMEGTWHIYRRPAGSTTTNSGHRWKRPAHTARCILTTASVQAVGFSLGELHVLPHAEEAKFFTHLGPDLLGPDWDLISAASRLSARPERSIGVALLDQRNLAGIGNIYRSEICFLARVAPDTPVAQVPDLEAMLEVAHRLLQVNRLRARRSTVGTASAGVQHWVYGREHKPCLRCGTRIIRKELGDEARPSAAADTPRAVDVPVSRQSVRQRPFGQNSTQRSVYFCPACQPGGAASGR